MYNNKKGLIALDIDGTAASGMHISFGVQNYLTKLNNEGWLIAFITGRPHCWSYPTVAALKFPLIFAFQNGATIMELPSKFIVSEQLLPITYFYDLLPIAQKYQTGIVVYAGYKFSDQCYYLEESFKPRELTLLLKRASYFGEVWLPHNDIDKLNLTEAAALKVFVPQSKAQQFSDEVEKNLKLHAPAIQDPFYKDYAVVQCTHASANKGAAVKLIKAVYGLKKVIAAGNDLNDLSMFAQADVAIAMEGSPQKLLNCANIVAPSPHRDGLIEGLTTAITL